jgi:Domain of unknown function (DUF6894)
VPRYFFNFVSGDRVIRDSKGVDLVGLEAAHWHVVKIAYQMRYHLPDDDDYWTIEITDAREETLEIFVSSFANGRRLALK